MDTTIYQAVSSFGNLALQLSDADLDRPWDWKGYDEGLRFILFRIYEELRLLSARLEGLRGISGIPVTTAQRTLAQHHSAFRDLQAVLLGVSDELAVRPPAEAEWPLFTTLYHITGVERNFYFIIEYTLRRARATQPMDYAMPEEEFDTAFHADEFPGLEKDGRLSELMAYYVRIHQRVMDAFSDIHETELSEGSIYWEEEAFPIEFRLHRFDSHLRQHTVQVEKTLLALNQAPGETKRLLRHIYNAAAECESVSLGTGELGAPFRQQTLAMIADYHAALAQAL